MSKPMLRFLLIRRRSLLSWLIAVGVPVFLFSTHAFSHYRYRPSMEIIVLLCAAYGLFDGVLHWRRGE
jgi:hypothetical protein